MLCKQIPLGKELKFGKYLKLTGDPMVKETMKRSWNLISSKEY